MSKLLESMSNGSLSHILPTGSLWWHGDQCLSSLGAWINSGHTTSHFMPTATLSLSVIETDVETGDCQGRVVG